MKLDRKRKKKERPFKKESHASSKRFMYCKVKIKSYYY